MTVVQEAKKAGLVKHIGFSSHQIDIAKKAVQSDHFETVLFPFNFITCEPAEELLPIAREHDVGVIAMKPLDGGMIENVTLAFKYLSQFPDVVPIPGIEKIQEIEEIVKLLEGPRQMTKAEQEEMQRLKEKLGKVFCRRCDYCQPCTAGIPISYVLDIKSLIKKQPPERVFLGPASGNIEKAANCQECGECEKRCPYHLPIMALVKENFSLFEKAKKKYLEQVASR
jgi:predicted aldo/keto reductase-like oxidoreductase